MAKYAEEEQQQEDLKRMASDSVYQSEILPKRFAVLDILEKFPDCALPFSAYLDMLKPLSPRVSLIQSRTRSMNADIYKQYSISSSPLSNPQYNVDKAGDKQTAIASLTYDVHDAPAWSGNGQFKGSASTYLASLEPGSKVRCFVKPTQVAFHLPPDPKTPVIMVAAGTGIAPMRGFIQERAALAAAKQQDLGPAILYFGCRHHEKDFIYADELKAWEDARIVSVRPAFSKVGPGKLSYVPDRIWEERDEVASLFRDGAKILLCGSASKLAKSTGDVCKKIWLEKNPDKTEKDANEWLNNIREERYVSDVFE